MNWYEKEAIYLDKCTNPTADKLLFSLYLNYFMHQPHHLISYLLRAQEPIRPFLLHMHIFHADISYIHTVMHADWQSGPSDRSPTP